MPLCPKCGNEHIESITKCADCRSVLGKNAENQANDGAPKRKKRNIAALVFGALSIVLAVAIVLSLTGVLGASGGAIASKSFSTPEEAIRYFVERLKTGDIEGALSACAINEMAEGYNFISYKAGVEQRQFLEPIRGARYLPSEYDLYVAYNANGLEERILNQMACFTVSFNLPEEFDYLINGFNVYRLENGQTPDDLIEALNPAKISGLEIVDIGKPYGHDSEDYREARKKGAEIFGADDEQARDVLYEYNGNYYIGGFNVIEYSGRWLIQEIWDPMFGDIPRLISDKSQYYNGLEKEQ